jgi:hypothetical protein
VGVGGDSFHKILGRRPDLPTQNSEEPKNIYLLPTLLNLKYREIIGIILFSE